MHRKSQFWLYLTLTLILSFIISTITLVSPVAANSTELYVDPPSIVDKGVGSTFTININIKDVTDLFNFDFKLWYKTSVLTATSVTVGSFLLPGYTPWRNVVNDTAGYVWYGISQSETTGVSGSGTLATITFTVDALGASSLYLVDTILYDSAQPLRHLIAHEVYDGYYVSPSVSVHDIALTSVTPNVTTVIPGQTISVNVTARNHGTSQETFNVAAYAYPARFYLPSSGTAPVSLSFSGDWENQTGVDRLKCATTRIGSAMTSKTSIETSSGSSFDVLTRQYVSDPIQAQTISGTVKGQIRAMESSTAANFMRAIVIKVVSNDGTVVRGTLLSYFPTSLTSEYATASLTNRKFPPSLTLTPVTALANDRIVIEIGTRAFNTLSTPYTATHSFGDDSDTDLPENEIGTSAFNPWIEFSQNILFTDDTAIPIGTPTAVTNLASGGRTTLTFTNTTTGLALGKYFISTNVTTTVSGETDTTDNTCNQAYEYNKRIFVGVTVTAIDYPEAVFTYSPTKPVVNQIVTFNASDSVPHGGEINSYRLDFGDGDSTSSPPPQTHTYTSHGTYNVTLTVEDTEGLSDKTWKLITIYSPPVADFTWTSLIAGIQVNFTSTSTDLDGSIVNWDWNFSDGTVGSGENVTHTYATAGDFTVNLTVTDNDGFNNTKTVTLTVFPEVIHNVAITSVTPSATNVVRGKNVTITVVAKNNGSETETFNVTAYYNTTAIGPAQTVTSLSPGDSTTLTFTWNTTNVSPGNYTIKANATIVEGEIETADNEKIDGKVTVNKVSSTIYITINPTSITLGESTTISGSITPTKPNVDVTISYRGTGTQTWNTLPTVATNSTSQYSYTWTPTTYGTFNLTSSWPGDANTLQDESDVKTLNVKAPPIASFTYTPSAPTFGDTVNFTSTSTDPDGSIVNWDWNFSDGTVGSGENVTHTYATAGDFTVNLTVTDNNGLTDTTTKSIIITKLSSTISISATPTTITIGESTTLSGSITPTRTGVTVTIRYRLSGGTWSTLETVTTDDNSQYSYTWTPGAAGTYEVKASWEGDANTLAAESDTATITVNEAPTGIPLYLIAAAGAIIIIASCIIAYFLIRKKP